MILNSLACATHRTNPHNEQNEEPVIHFATHTLQLLGTRSNKSLAQMHRKLVGVVNILLLINKWVGLNCVAWALSATMATQQM